MVLAWIMDYLVKLRYLIQMLPVILELFQKYSMMALLMICISIMVLLKDYQLGLWMPDSYDSIRLEPRYAVRFANRNVPWWTDADGGYGINILGVLQIEQ